MLEEIGKELALLFEEIDFIGVQYSPDVSYCCFNCKRTGTTFCANTYDEVKNRLEFIRNNFKHLTERA